MLGAAWAAWCPQQGPPSMTSRHGTAQPTTLTQRSPRGLAEPVLCLCLFPSYSLFLEYLIGNLHVAGSFLKTVLMKVCGCVHICVCHLSRLTPYKSPLLLGKLIKGNHENLISSHLHKIHRKFS